MKHSLSKLKKIGKTSLVVLLILSILSTAFGTTVLAVTSLTQNDKQTEKDAPTADEINEEKRGTTQLDEFEGLENEAVLCDDIIPISEQDSKAFENSILEARVQETYSDDSYYVLTLQGEDHAFLNDRTSGDIIFLQGEEGSVFGGDRFLEILSCSSYNGQTRLEVDEPDVDRVFKSLEICASDALTEENFIGANYTEGVTSHFGDAENEIQNVSQTGEVSAEPLAPTDGSTPVSEATGGSELNSKKVDLILNVDVDFSKLLEDEDKDDEAAETSFGIKGQIGIEELTAHIVCNAPSWNDIQDLYFGVSGKFIAGLDFYGKLSVETDTTSAKRDLWIAELEGLEHKRFPLAAFEFKGTTPIVVTNFEARQDDLLPNLYIVIYSDWQGSIDFEFSAGFNYFYDFDAGLRICQNGEFCPGFVNYPFLSESHEDDGAQSGWDFHANLELSADTDLTIVGGSVLFYIGGINLCEISIAKLGIEAQCHLEASASTQEGFKLLNQESTNAYIRGYLKFLEIHVKFKAEGKSILSFLSADVEFDFNLFDFTLFEWGIMPEKYRPLTPVSSMPIPETFHSATILVADVSGSMEDQLDSGQTKRLAAIEATKVILNSTQNLTESLEGNYGFGLVQFSSTAKTVSPPHVDYEYLKACADTMAEGGGTYICEGLKEAITHLDGIDCPNKVIILMTDGIDQNESATREIAAEAAEKGILIYTIGFGYDAQEALLQDIATQTGGEYRFADTQNVIDIIAGFMRAQQSTISEIVYDEKGTVSEGETTEAKTFKVDGESGVLTVQNTWPGSFLETILTDPHGRRVDESYPGATVDESQIPSCITIQNPIKGSWKVAIKGVETSYEDEPYYTLVSFAKTESEKVNPKMNTLEQIASHAFAIGFVSTLVCSMLLVCLGKDRRK